MGYFLATISRTLRAAAPMPGGAAETDLETTGVGVVPVSIVGVLLSGVMLSMPGGISVPALASTRAAKPSPLTALRQQLFGIAAANEPRSALAERCLIAIEKLRDEHGRIDDEPRHPDIDSGQAWPLTK
jgi:hypothetical protein